MPAVISITVLDGKCVYLDAHTLVGRSSGNLLSPIHAALQHSSMRCYLSRSEWFCSLGICYPALTGVVYRIEWKLDLVALGGCTDVH